MSPYGFALDDEPDIINETVRNNRPHPSRRHFAQDVDAVAGDLVPRSSLVMRVYDSELVMKFLARVTGEKDLYQFADEFQCINIFYMYDGGLRAWHYDAMDTVITLILQVTLFILFIHYVVLQF